MGKIATQLSEQRVGSVSVPPIGGVSMGADMPTVQRSFQPKPIPDAVQPKFGLRQAAMFSDITDDLMRVSLTLQKRNEAKKDYEDALWVEEQDTSTKKAWITWYDQIKDDPPEGMVQTFDRDFNAHLNQLIEQAPSDKAKLALKQSLNNFGLDMLKTTMLLEAKTNVKKTTLRLNTQLATASDLIAASNSPKVLFDQMSILREGIKAAKSIGLITDDIAQSFNNSVSLLGADAVEHFAINNPKMAKAVLDDLTDLPLDRRTALEEKIGRISNTHSTLFKAEQTAALKSNIAQILNTGQASELFNIEAYKEAHSDGDAFNATNQIKVAHKMYSVRQEMLGKSKADIEAVLSKNSPKNKTEIGFDEQQDVYESASRFAHDQIKLMEEDPFTYALQDPVVKELQDQFISTKAKDKTPLYQSLIAANLAFQESIGIPDGMRSVITRSDAKRIAANINAALPDQVERGFFDLMQQYGQYYPDVFRDLSRLPQGERIDTSLQIIAHHAGKPWVNDFLQATRANKDALNLSPADNTALESEIRSNKDISSFRSAVSSSDPRNLGYASDYSDAIKTFAASLYLRGKATSPEKAVDMATQLIISSTYGFGEVNGMKYAISRNIVGDNNNPITMGDDEVRSVSSELSSILKDKRNLKILNPANIDDRVFVMPTELKSEDRLKLIDAAIADSAYWATTSDNQGVVLMIPGMGGTSAPLKTKDGREIKITFKQALSRAYGRKASYDWNMRDLKTANDVVTP